jgi:hypothetical protein
MSQSETEHERKVREYWATVYNKNLPYEPTAVLTKTKNNNNPQRRFSVYDIGSNLDKEDY